jgi:hypothetical protein
MTTTYAGVATVENDHLAIRVDLDEEKIALVSGEVSIREWPAGGYQVIDLGSGEFVIESEDDAIQFVPDDPRSFALGLQRGPGPQDGRPGGGFEVQIGPPPKPLTLVGFWALAAVTAALGIWGLVSLL